MKKRDHADSRTFGGQQTEPPLPETDQEIVDRLTEEGHRRAREASHNSGVANPIPHEEEDMKLIALTDAYEAGEHAQSLYDLAVRAWALGHTYRERYESPTNNGIDPEAQALVDRLVAENPAIRVPRRPLSTPDGSVAWASLVTERDEARAEANEYRERLWALRRELPDREKNVRAETIEECAKLAERDARFWEEPGRLERAEAALVSNGFRGFARQLRGLASASREEQK